MVLGGLKKLKVILEREGKELDNFRRPRTSNTSIEEEDRLANIRSHQMGSGLIPRDEVASGEVERGQGFFRGARTFGQKASSPIRTKLAERREMKGYKQSIQPEIIEAKQEAYRKGRVERAKKEGARKALPLRERIRFGTVRTQQQGKKERPLPQTQVYQTRKGTTYVRYVREGGRIRQIVEKQPLQVTTAQQAGISGSSQLGTTSLTTRSLLDMPDVLSGDPILQRAKEGLQGKSLLDLI